VEVSPEAQQEARATLVRIAAERQAVIQARLLTKGRDGIGDRTNFQGEEGSRRTEFERRFMGRDRVGRRIGNGQGCWNLGYRAQSRGRRLTVG
jgi:hypothetical protein